MTTEATGHMPGRQDRFTLLYDGECPLCRREIEWFCRRDPEAMHVVDISLDGFDSNTYGLASDDVHRELHGIKPDGTITVGMDSVREAYRVIGLGFMVSFTAYWPFRPITDWMYRRFAANRLQIGTAGWADGSVTKTRANLPRTPPKGEFDITRIMGLGRGGGYSATLSSRLSIRRVAFGPRPHQGAI